MCVVFNVRSAFADGTSRCVKHNLNVTFRTAGAGKSLCYQVPAWATKKTVLVVSPLISLMQDQVHR